MAFADKQATIEKFKINENDKGSVFVQIALLTERINYLIAHLKVHRKDHHTKRGLLILVGRRKRLQKYLLKKDPEKYQELIKELKLKK
ncbi:MAG: 30S ribosomal protein S15 [Candidatus Margulisiibacteriota bacterium]